MKFNELNLSQDLVAVTEQLNYLEMTPVQAQSIPVLLEGRDLIGQSKTGSGKTAAFCLPILQNLKIRSERGDTELQALILCPTRELCAQVTTEVRKLGRGLPGLTVLAVAGGQPLYTQTNALNQGTHIVVGTPGRVLDHLRRRNLDLSRIHCLVLDEADRMLDMGFQEDMELIFAELPQKRQTVLFSATFPSAIEAMSQAYQRNPARVTIEAQTQSEPTIRQVWYLVSHEDKLKATLWVLQQKQPTSGVIFCNMKRSVDELTVALTRAGVSVAALHGDLEQSQRDRVMAKFRNKSVQFLVATDVAARGIDVQDLDLVFNFDLPTQADIYVHRVGRTGRAGKKGFAASLVTPRERGKINMIEASSGFTLKQLKIDAIDHLQIDGFSQILKQQALMDTLYIGGGRKEKVRPGDILGALTGEAGRLGSEFIGKIEIHDRFSYVAIDKQFSQIAISRLRDGKIKGRKFKIEAVK